MTPEEENLRMMEEKSNYNAWLYDSIAEDLKGDILEVGCGVGTMINTMLKNKKIKSITGTDINKKNITLAKKNIKNKKVNILNQNILTSLKGLKKYDCVICINVLEHIENDIFALKQMKKILKKRGKLIIIVPALQSIYGTIDKSDNHYRRYNKKELKLKITETGMTIKKIKYMNFVGVLGWIYHGKIRKLKVHKNNDLSLFNKLVPLLKKIENIVSPPIGLSLVMVGIKND